MRRSTCEKVHKVHTERKLRRLTLALIFFGALGVFGAAVLSGVPRYDIAYADKNSPPDESIRDESGEENEKLKEQIRQMEQERLEKERRAEEARKKAVAAKKKTDAQKAATEKKRTEDNRKITVESARRRTVDAGRGMVEDGRYREALHLLRGHVAANPKSADAWYWIARAHHALGDYDRAQAAVNLALEIDPHYPALTKTPSGLQAIPNLTKQQRKEPRPLMSVLPVKQPLPANLALEPVTISFPRLIETGRPAGGDAGTENPELEPGARDPATGAYLLYEPYPPYEPARTVAWQQSEKFQEISRWRFRVDRMGILEEPRVPIAWKGSHPYEVYFWTGGEWARVRRQRAAYEHQETYDDILAHAKASIEEVLNARAYRWNERDTPSLAANASLMRYKWIGDVGLADAQARAEKRAREKFVYDSWEPVKRDGSGEAGDGGSSGGSGSGGGSSGGGSGGGNSGGGDDGCCGEY